jgi:hypothetical protein
VYKKQENCDPNDPADAHRGDYWDHIAFDPERRLVVCVEPGARVGESVEAVIGDFKRRAPTLQGRDPPGVRGRGDGHPERAAGLRTVQSGPRLALLCHRP